VVIYSSLKELRGKLRSAYATIKVEYEERVLVQVEPHGKNKEPSRVEAAGNLVEEGVSNATSKVQARRLERLWGREKNKVGRKKRSALMGMAQVGRSLGAKLQFEGKIYPSAKKKKMTTTIIVLGWGDLTRDATADRGVERIVFNESQEAPGDQSWR